MSAVMIKCPNTGRAVSTQIETEPSVFRELPYVKSRTRCPICGEEHEWTPLEAWLADAPVLQSTRG